MEEKKNQPDYVSKFAAQMADEIILHYDLMAGTKAVRAKGSTYMPRLPLESDGGWNSKVAGASLYNKSRDTVNTMVGLVLRREPKIADDGDKGFTEAFTKHWENITSDGVHGKQFLQFALRHQFAGHVFIVVDFPPKDESVKDKVDERSAQRRPFWSLYTANQAINWNVGLVENKSVLTQITFKEIIAEPDGDYGTTDAIYYRTWYLKSFDLQGQKFKRAAWKLHRETRTTEGEIKILPMGEGVTKLTILPVKIAYGQKEGIARSRPPLVDLYYKNIQHYQDYADYRKGKSIAGLAILWTQGLTGQDAAIGWDVMLKLDGEKTGAGFIEANGSALEAHRLSLEDTKTEMNQLGMSLLVDNAAQPMTATQAVIDFAQSSSQLLTIADSLKDAVEGAVEIHGEYLSYSKEQVCSMDLGYKPEELVLTPQNIDLLFRLYDGGLITAKTLLSCFKGGGSLPDEMDIKKEIAAARVEFVNRSNDVGTMLGKTFDAGMSAKDLSN